ncbi:MAG: N-formylglutamate amidohydrolase [Rhodospirillales bacterium]|nr:MAG: N-formylglutamate amidohydrolase [Rhodospirillales bacterium]
MRDSKPGVYDLWLPERAASPVVFDSPHSGADYPVDFETIAPEARLRRAEDMFVEDLFAAAPERGAVLLAARFPRSYIDPNRSESDIDRRLIDGAWRGPVAVTEKTRLGHGLIWRLCPPDLPIYDRKLSVDEVQARIEGYYRPYHAALAQAIDGVRGRFGAVYHVNCHSMPTVSAPLVGDTRDARRRADFVLGDREGTSCSAEFRHMVRDTLEAMGYVVALNDPYKGVELIEAYSDPADGRHSLQIEINRGLYMDEERFERGPGYARLKADIDALIAAICDFAAGGRIAEAAE